MKHIQIWLAVIVFLICASVLADNTNDPFKEVAAKYLAANPKPGLSEEARKFKVQAEFAVQEKQFVKAAELYGKALDIAPWWPEGHFNRALILSETKKYRDAMREMRRYLLLVPDASNARAAQDKIYQWEVVAEPEAGKVFKDCPECPEMVEIPAGGHAIIKRSFAIGKTEVTQGHWKAVMGNNPSNFRNCGDNCPVEKVSWNDVQKFIKKLNAETGKEYRLPTMWEWLYACSNGLVVTVDCGKDRENSVAWHGGNSEGTTHPVGRKQPNNFGLYDMSGNVWEWLEDCFGSCEHRGVGGSSWLKDQRYSRAGIYGYGDADDRYDDGGFRLARELP